MPTDVATSLPDLDLRDQSILTVDTGDPNAIITSLVIHVSQDIPAEALALLPPLLAHIPVEG
jgi:hypothetical protein